MYCKYCGKKIADDSKFCAECGKRLDGKGISNLLEKFISSIPVSEETKKILLEMKGLLLCLVIVIVLIVIVNLSMGTSLFGKTCAACGDKFIGASYVNMMGDGDGVMCGDCAEYYYGTMSEMYRK